MLIKLTPTDRLECVKQVIYINPAFIRTVEYSVEETGSYICLLSNKHDLFRDIAVNELPEEVLSLITKALQI